MRVTHSEFRYTADVGPAPAPTPVESTGRTVATKAAIGSTIGLAGGIALAVPVVLYDWISSNHSFWELPMAATSWMFGMEHFALNGVKWGSVVVGLLLLAAYSIASGAVFEYLGDRVLRLGLGISLVAAGLAFGFASWLFFWYTLLPIAHGGAPFYSVTVGSLPVMATVSVAPIWVFVLGFALLGLVTSAAYVSLRRL